jgi:hypothetical protein
MMARTTTSFALAALLASAPLVAAAAPDRPAAAESMRFERAAPSPATTGPSESSAPTTPMPLNLPDEATTQEVQSQYAIGIATLVIGTLVLAAIVVGALYIVARRTWMHPTH